MMKTKTGMGSGSAYWQMRVLVFFLLFIWVFVHSIMGYSLKNCTIEYTQNATGNMRVVCYDYHLKSLPDDIPPMVRYLDLSFNFISQVERGTFSDLVFLEELALSYNLLTSILDHTFHGLDSLLTLYLNNNNISTIAPSSFQFLPNLKVVNLNRNNLVHIEKLQPIFQSPHLQELYIQLNTFRYFSSLDISKTTTDLRILDISLNPLEVFSIKSDVFPHLNMLIFKCYSSSLQWNLQNRSLLRNLTSFSVANSKLSVDVLSIMLHSFNSLTKLILNNIGEEKAKVLMNIACHMPTLRTLELQGNNLHLDLEELLESCTQLTDLDLSCNNIKTLSELSFRSMRQITCLRLESNQFLSVPNATIYIPTLEILDLSGNHISNLGCSDFANLTALKELLLVRNVITNLKGCVFQDLCSLEILNLEYNQIQTFSEAKEHLQNMRGLNMVASTRSSKKAEYFKGLQSLKELDLSYNKIEEIEDGIFEGLPNLTTLRLSSNKIKSFSLATDVFRPLKSLTTLDISSNEIVYYSVDPVIPPPFSAMSSLISLNIDSQKPKGIIHLPKNFLYGLKSLLTFSARDLHMKSLHPDTFIYTPTLKSLNISGNDFSNKSTALPSKMFHPISNLEILTLSESNLQSLDFVILANLTQLRYLDVHCNKVTEVSEAMIHSLPTLDFINLVDNSFTCDCRNALFIHWVKENKQTQVVKARDIVCQDQKGTKLLDLDIHACWVGPGFYCFVCTFFLVLFTLLGSFIYHFMRWHVVYAYYLFMAYLHDTKRRTKPVRYLYDAFVSYNVHDEPWVLGELLPELEGQQGWKLCLHHRDFQPGKLIVDNITDAIYGSRKTICVISYRYLESEWCSRELQVASFRLFDEQKDVLILLFLEDIPSHHLSPYYRMRKLLKRRTYLSWPKAEEHIRVFWQKCQLALNTRESLNENPILTGRERI